jgi:iron complex transport system ATP-binding protein
VNAISIRSLSFSYGKSEILRDVSLGVKKAAFTAILGRNGTGKSTLLRIIAGLLPEYTGIVEIGGTNIRSLSLMERAGMVGFLPQFHKPVFPFSVADVVLTGRARFIGLSPSAGDRKAAMEALDRIGIAHLASRPYTDLSGGEQQLVLIARLLAQNPKILLFDEPTSHLDIKNQSRFFRLIRAFIDDGLTVCAVLHDPGSAFLHADELLFTNNNSVCGVQGGSRSCDPVFLKTVFDVDFDFLHHKGRRLVVPRK